MSSPPPHVKQIVDEIEPEIGEVPGASTRYNSVTEAIAAAAIEGDAVHLPDEADGGVEAAVRQILEEIGEDPDRQGLLGTPERVHRMDTELTAGHHGNTDRLINGAVFDVDYRATVVGKDIPFYSLCGPALLPFFGPARCA